MVDCQTEHESGRFDDIPRRDVSLRNSPVEIIEAARKLASDVSKPEPHLAVQIIRAIGRMLVDLVKAIKGKAGDT